MSDSYRAVCSDFYVNQKLQVKMDLPRGRETVLDLFERVRKQYPGMNQFRRYRDELALESPQSEAPHRWLAVRTNNVRTGTVNAPTPEESASLHKAILDLGPVFLNISALDVDYLEVLFGFDLMSAGNHDAIVFDTLFGASPLASLMDVQGLQVADCQPMVGLSLGRRGDVEMFVEVKTRASQHVPKDPDGGEPISVYLTLRKMGSIKDLAQLETIRESLTNIGEELVETRIVPRLLVPLRDAIASGNA
jgi:hypothetical protein